MIAEEAPDRAGQHVAAHGGSRQAAGRGPHQPVGPGDHHPADHDRGGDDPEVPGADQRQRAQRAGQVHDVDQRQGGQGHRAHRARDHIGGLRGRRGGKTIMHFGVSYLRLLSSGLGATDRESNVALNY